LLLETGDAFGANGVAVRLKHVRLQPVPHEDGRLEAHAAAQLRDIPSGQLRLHDPQVHLLEPDQ